MRTPLLQVLRTVPSHLVGLASILAFLLGLLAAVSVERLPQAPNEMNIQIVFDARSSSLLLVAALFFGYFMLLRRRARSVRKG